MFIVPVIYIRDIKAVGSQITCDPPPDIEDSDYDFLVLVWSMRRAQRQLEKQGWTIERSKCGAYGGIPGGNFFSARMLDHNLIVTSKRLFFNRFWTATQLAKNLNLLKKDDRKTLFSYILYRQLDK